MDTSLRPMSTSQVLDRTFFLYRKNFVLFAGIALVTPTLILIASLAQVAMFGIPTAPSPAGGPAGMAAFFGRAAIGGIITLIIYTIGYAITSGATVHAVSMLHLGRTTTIKESYERVKPIWGRLILLVIRISLAAMAPLIVGYVILVILAIVIVAITAAAGVASGHSPSGVGMAAGVGLGILVVFVGLLGAGVWGVIVYCRYALAVPACTIENLPIKYALIRSRFLSKGNLGRVFAVYLLTAIMAFAIKALLQAPIYMSSGFSFRTGLHLSPALLAWTYASGFIGSMVAGPIAAIAMALVYYDERVRKEAFDLQVMMDSMKTTEPVQVAGV